MSGKRDVWPAAYDSKSAPDCATAVYICKLTAGAVQMLAPSHLPSPASRLDWPPTASARITRPQAILSYDAPRRINSERDRSSTFWRWMIIL